MNEQDAKKVLEAVLFSSSDILPAKEIAGIIGNLKVPQVREMVLALNTEYETTNRTFRIVRVGDGYQMRTLPMYKTWIVKTEPLKPLRLTPPALETLAIVAYRQPVTRGDIEQVRGVAVSSNIVRTLLEREWVRVVGYKEVPGRPAMYGTTKAFLDYFNLKSLVEMPPLAEVRALVEPELADEAALAGGPDPEISMPLAVETKLEPSEASDESDVADEADEPTVVLPPGGAEIVPLPNIDRSQ